MPGLEGEPGREGIEGMDGITGPPGNVLIIPTNTNSKGPDNTLQVHKFSRINYYITFFYTLNVSFRK